MDRVRLLCLVGFSASFAIAAGAQPPSPPPAPAPSPGGAANEARRAGVIAKVGASTITVGQVEDAIAAQAPFLRARFRSPQQLRAYVDNLIRFELLAAEAGRRGMGDLELVRRTTEQNAVQHLIRTDFDRRITPESIPAADVQRYYDSHRDDFFKPAMVRASHILVATREEAAALITKVRDGDARLFRQLAREGSVDTETNQRGGDLRYFDQQGHGVSRDDAPVDAALVAAAFALAEVGDVVAEPVQVGERFSVLKLTGKRAEENRPFAEAEPGIRQRLWRERREEALQEYVAGLRTRANVEVHAERMDPIRLDEAPGPGDRSGFPQSPTFPAGRTLEEAHGQGTPHGHPHGAEDEEHGHSHGEEE